MDSGLSFALAGEERRGRDLFNENAPLFQQSLQKELTNITLPGEGELANKIKEAEDRYQALALTFWDTSDLEARRKMYFSALLPLFTEVKNNAQEVISINQENMLEADRRARSLAASLSPYLVGHGTWSRRRIASERASNFLIFSAMVGILRAGLLTRARSSRWISR